MGDYSDTQIPSNSKRIPIIFPTDPDYYPTGPNFFQKITYPLVFFPYQFSKEPTTSPSIKSEQNPFQIVTFESLADKDLTDAEFLLFNRESRATQEHGHEAKMEALRIAHASLGIKPPILEDSVIGSGKLDILAGKSTSSPDYFDWLRKRIRSGLEKTPFGKPLFVMFATRSRLMRPMGYDYRKAPMIPYAERDYDLFNDWLHRSFPERTKDIVFVVLKLGDPKEERGFETKLGKDFFENPGGRPRNLKTAKGRKQFKKMLCDEAIGLARTQGMNAVEILRFFEEKYKSELLAVKLIGARRMEQLLKKAGCHSKPGRPKKIVMPF